MNKSLIIYEYPVALYDVYHWIERFKEKITKLTKLNWFEKDYFEIELKNNEYEEKVTICSFEHLLTGAFNKKDFYKIVIIGRVPTENKKIMNILKELLYNE